MDNQIFVSYINNADQYSTKPVFQYDNGVVIHISNIPSTAVLQTHYSIEGMRNAFVYIPEYNNEYWISKVPNVFLAQEKPVQIYVYVTFDDGGKTIMRITMPIKTRPKPDDYVLTEEELHGFDYVLQQLNSTVEIVEDLKTNTEQVTAEAKEAARLAIEATEQIDETIQNVLEEENYIKTLNDVPPDESGNIKFTINGSAPDPITGDFQIDTGTGNVQSVNGEQPDENGNVVLNLEDIYFEDAEEDVTEEGSVVTLPIIADQATDALKLGGVDANQYALKSEVEQLTAEDLGALPADGTAVNADMLGGKPPSAYTAVNLLDNSDFSNPVNTVGYVSGTIGAYDECIDRWLLLPNTVLELGSDYVTLTGNYDIRQIVSHKLKAGTAYTMAARMCASGGTRNLWLVADDSAGTRLTSVAVQNSGTWVTVVCSFIPNTDLDDINVYITNSNDVAVGTNIAWVALYEGSYTADNLPPYTPKGYAAELLACKTADTGGIDADTLGGKTPEYYIQPRNLLDNSDFTNPVNQRGLTTYEAPSGAPYNIDRWYGNRATIVVEDDGITLNRNTTASTSSTYIGQKMEHIERLEGKTLTLAFMTDIGLFIGSFEFADRNITILTQDGWTLAYSTSVKAFIIQSGTETSIKLYWAALYEGKYTADTLPPYVPKGYAAELLECQRYFITVNNAIIAGFGYNAETTGQFYLPLPTTLRIAKTDEKPTVNVKLYGSVRGLGSVVIPTAVSVYTTGVSETGLSFELTGAFTGSSQKTLIWVGQSLEISADL